jgi:hypothetical protein
LIFAAGMKLESASQIAQPAVRQRIDAAARDLDQALRLILDQALRLIRDAIFGLEHRLRGRRLSEEGTP